VTPLEFDQTVADELDVVYRRRDHVRRRELVHDALGAQPGERVLDAGCGPGFYVADLLERVGAEGSVVGVDTSPQMLAMTAKRAPRADLREGAVTALPVEDSDFDRALSVQVLEYVDDIPAALSELRRALRPGGRLVIWDVDWATVSWHSRDPDRMRRVLEAWDAHLSDPSLPRTLAASMRAADFADVQMQGHAFTTIELDEESYAGAMRQLLADFVGGDEAREWLAEQGELAERGEAYSAVTQLCFTGTRPA
jgi:arsenite methyltransferase